MLRLENPADLAKRLGLSIEPDILGFSLWYEKGEKRGFIQKFKFKFDTVNTDRNCFKFGILKTPTNKTDADTYIYDYETAVMIKSVFLWFTGVSPQIYYVLSIQQNDKNILSTVLVESAKEVEYC
ncbi:hypothetical protein ACQWTT_001104 [Acinetobacter baumannii]